MEQFSLNVAGFNGSLTAKVSFNGVEIDTFPVRDIKDAEKKARQTALNYKAENSPAPRVNHTATFTV